MRWSIPAIIFVVAVAVVGYLICYGLIRARGNTNILTGPYNTCIAWATRNPAHLRPMLSLELFPEHKVLESAAGIIRNEITAYLQQFQPLSANTSSNVTFGKAFTDDGWRLVMLQFYGKQYPGVQQYFPQTMACLRQCGTRVRIAMFSIVHPFTEIRLHVGPFRGSMRYHLGLVVPASDACYLQVSGETHTWNEGASLLFDDTYPHLVRNNTPHTRIILFLDIQRQAPSLNPAMALVNHLICHSPLIHHLSQLNEQNENPVPIISDVINKENEQSIQ